jgi:hypothetical protein
MDGFGRTAAGRYRVPLIAIDLGVARHATKYAISSSTSCRAFAGGQRELIRSNCAAN